VINMGQSVTAEIETPEFVERLKRLDGEAYRLLVEKLQDRLYRLILRIVRNPQEAEEVLQETFLAVFDKIDTFQQKSKLSTWIYAIASNHALSRLRKKSAQTVTIEDDSNLNSDGELLRNRTTLFSFDNRNDALLQKELKEKLEEAIEALPDGYRELFVLREIEKLSIKEIAEILELNPGVVKTRLHRARLQLRAILSDYWEGGVQ